MRTQKWSEWLHVLSVLLNKKKKKKKDPNAMKLLTKQQLKLFFKTSYNVHALTFQMRFQILWRCPSVM